MTEVAPDGMPNWLVSETEQRIAYFTTGFVETLETWTGPQVQLRGSGTLVQVGSVKAILTAYHVLENLPKSGRLSLILSRRPGAHSAEFDGLDYVKIALGANDEEGPDLGAVILPPLVASFLVARKLFVNLELHRERMLNRPPALDDGLWRLCGYQEVSTEDVEPTAGSDQMRNFRGFCAAGRAEHADSPGARDDLAIQIPHDQGSEPPETFGGASGGGLWQVLLREKADGQTLLDGCLLSGIAFDQAQIEGSSCVKCHGRKSIYEVAYNAIRQCANVD